MLNSQRFSAGSSESEVEVFSANNSAVFGGTMLRMKCNPIVLSLRAPCISFSTQGSAVEPKSVSGQMQCANLDLKAGALSTLSHCMLESMDVKPT